MDQRKVNKWSHIIRETIDSRHYIGGEINGNLQVAISCADIRNMDVYLFGKFINMDCFVQFFLHEHLCVKAVIDRSGERVGGVIMDIPIISLEEFLGDIAVPENTIMFSFSQMEGEEWENFKKVIELSKIQKVIYIDSITRATITTNTSEEWDRNRIQYYRENAEKILELLPYYADEESYRVMNEYIRTYIERDAYKHTEIPSQYKYFYDAEKKDLYSHLNDEVWLNFGASTGDSLFVFFRNGLKAEKIYAVEADKDRYDQLIENMKLLPKKMRETVVAKNIFVDEKTDLDKLIKDRKITLINADIEGAELQMLRLLEDRIRQDHPVLAICMYHKKEDLIEIPFYIIQLYDGYRFILRKYAYCWANQNRNYELVLYAIPENRKVE